MLNALRAELFKTVRRRMTYILLLSLSGLITLYYLLLWWQIRHQPTGRRGAIREFFNLRDGMSFDGAIPYALQLERFFVTLVCIVFVATMLANEYDWRTASVALGRGVKRHHFLAAKAIVGLGFVLLSVTLGFVVALGWSAWFSFLYDLPFGAVDWALARTALEGVGRLVFAVIPFAALALFLATIFRSAGQAVGVAAGVFFLEALFTGVLTDARGLLSHVPEVLLASNLRAVLAANGAVRESTLAGPLGLVVGESTIPIWRAAAVVTAWTAFMVTASFWRFQRRDIDG